MPRTVPPVAPQAGGWRHSPRRSRVVGLVVGDDEGHVCEHAWPGHAWLVEYQFRRFAHRRAARSMGRDGHRVCALAAAQVAGLREGCATAVSSRKSAGSHRSRYASSGSQGNWRAAGALRFAPVRSFGFRMSGREGAVELVKRGECTGECWGPLCTSALTDRSRDHAALSTHRPRSHSDTADVAGRNAATRTSQQGKPHDAHL
jgi:hypothetical protein